MHSPKCDAILDMMRRNGVPESRENYLALAYMGNPPAKLSAEEEFQLPNQFRKKQFRDNWMDE
jgi:hypothetical protein